MCQQHSQYGKWLARQFQADSVTAEFSCSQIKGEFCEAEDAALGGDGHENTVGDVEVYHHWSARQIALSVCCFTYVLSPSGLAVDLEIDFQLTPCELWPRQKSSTFRSQRLSDPTGEPS
jgi:hypothetical protein